MKLELSEKPEEWRKSAWMSALGFAIGSSLLYWRHVLPKAFFVSVLAFLVVVAFAAGLQPSWFRGYAHVSARAGFGLGKMAGRIVLALFFFAVLTPLGMVMRMFHKDPLRLRRPAGVQSYWNDARPKSPLERLF